MRGAVTSFILHNAADLPHGVKDSSTSLTLITNDTDRILASFQMFHELWSIPAEVCLGLWLLARELGIGSLGPAIIVLCRSLGICQ